MGAFTLIGKLIAGTVFDRSRAPFVLAFLLLVDAVAVFMLVSVQTSTAIFALAIVGFVQGAVMAAIPYCVVRYFGLKFFASISGMINFLLGLSAFGPVLFSILRDTSGSYSSRPLKTSLRARAKGKKKRPQSAEDPGEDRIEARRSAA